MKILYHHRIASKDGQYVHIEEIVHALRGHGHEVIVVEPGSINHKEFGQSSTLVSKLRKILPNFIHELAEFCYSFIDYVKLVKAIKRHKPDCIYERYNLYFPSGIWAKKKFNLPLILEVNAPLYEERRLHDGISLNRLADWSERFTWTNADLVLPVTGVLGRKIRNKGVPDEQIIVIPNGINPEEFSKAWDGGKIREQLGLGGKLIMGFTGFVREWHRLDRVLDVIAQNREKNWHLLVVGDGPVRESLKARAKQLDILNNVTFTGVVKRSEIPDYVSCFDIALQPDVVEYASPLKLFEYLALGVPVLAPNKENIREVLTDGENALLFNPEDDADFVKKLTELCLSETMREKLAKASRQLIQTRSYYWNSNAEKIENLFSALINKPNEIIGGNETK